VVKFDFGVVMFVSVWCLFVSGMVLFRFGAFSVGESGTRRMMFSDARVASYSQCGGNPA
jgi:hypothetical protein